MTRITVAAGCAVGFTIGVLIDAPPPVGVLMIGLGAMAGMTFGATLGLGDGVRVWVARRPSRAVATGCAFLGIFAFQFTNRSFVALGGITVGVVVLGSFLNWILRFDDD